MSPPALASWLESRLAVERRAELAGIDGLDALLHDQHAAGAAAWPGVSLAAQSYVEHVARYAGARERESLDRVLRTLPAADVYLAAACCDGSSAAIAAFRTALAPSLRQALGKLAMNTAAIDEVVHRVMVEVFVHDGGAPQIWNYSGRGPLRAWLRTIGVRMGRRMLGSAAREHGEDGLDELADRVANPELEVLRGLYQERAREALSVAMTRITPRQRELLRRYYVDGDSIDRLAAQFEINRSTAARWVAAARLAVVAETRAHLAELLESSPDDADSILRLVRSQLQLSMRALFGPSRG